MFQIHLLLTIQKTYKLNFNILLNLMVWKFILMNSFKLFGCKRKLEVFSAVEGFFELHSIALRKEKKIKTELKTAIS